MSDDNWRRSKLYRIWRLAVILLAGRICVICANTKELHAHHIQCANTYPELRYVVENGACICNDCHKFVHNDIAGGYRVPCEWLHFNILKGLRYHRRILRRKKEKLMKKVGLRI